LMKEAATQSNPGEARPFIFPICSATKASMVSLLGGSIVSGADGADWWAFYIIALSALLVVSNMCGTA